MARKRYTAEQIIGLLRQAEVMIGQGQSMDAVLREIDVTGNTYYRWRKEYGGLGVDQARRLKELEQENSRLKRVVAACTEKRSIYQPSLQDKRWDQGSGRRHLARFIHAVRLRIHRPRGENIATNPESF